ncbi:MAG: hypothetical protein WBW33_06135 [Bryobacteraceae bacterium]
MTKRRSGDPDAIKDDKPVYPDKCGERWQLMPPPSPVLLGHRVPLRGETGRWIPPRPPGHGRKNFTR